MWIYWYCFLLAFLIHSITGNETGKDAKLPPCGACKNVIGSFNNILNKSGDQVPSQELFKKLCSDVSRGEKQCKKDAQLWKDHLEEWLGLDKESRPTLLQSLCVDKLEACCPEGHFGPDCKQCSFVGQNNKVCTGNGKCKGSGTRKGSGACQCDQGYNGDMCELCADSYFMSYHDDEKTLCSPCHHACLGKCTGAGPKKCLACKYGYVMHAELGCQDIDECAAKRNLCQTNQFCVNAEGTHQCIPCDESCKRCTGVGPDSCTECATGYTRSGQDRICVKDEAEAKIFTISNVRFFTYGGLCVAAAIIFQRSTIVAGILGLAIALYISLSEYYLQGATGELQPVSE